MVREDRIDAEVDNGSDDGNHNRQNCQTQVVVSAAEKVLARARDRTLDVVITQQHSLNQCKRKQHGWDGQSHVSGTKK